MSNLIKVSVVMPFYNCAKTIKSSVNSILNQSFSDFELLLINDGSNDKSLEIIKEFQDSRISLVNLNANIGISRALNLGLQLSKGEFIVRMDADDIARKNRIEVLYKFMISNPEIGVCGSRVNCFNDLQNWNWDVPLDNVGIKAGLINGATFCHPSVIIRKSILFQNNIFYNEKFDGGEDYLLWLNLAEVTSFSNVKDYLLDYRVEDIPDKEKRRNEIKNNVKIYFFHKISKDDVLKILIKSDEKCISYLKLNIEINEFLAKLSLLFSIEKKSLSNQLNLMLFDLLKSSEELCWPKYIYLIKEFLGQLKFFMLVRLIKNSIK